MKFVRESTLETAFATMMNKLVFARKEILQALLDGIRSENHKASLLRINEIETALDGMAERRQTLTTIMTKGYIDPAAYTQETNDLLAEAAVLEDERDRAGQRNQRRHAQNGSAPELLKYTGKGEMLSEFDADLFERFVDHITVCSREEVQIHLKCGLCLRERIE